MKKDPYKKFSDAIDIMVFSEKPMQERVLDAYSQHITSVEIEEIPQNVQYLFTSFQRCMEPRLKNRKFGDPEARQIARVILFIAEEIKKISRTRTKTKRFNKRLCLV